MKLSIKKKLDIFLFNLISWTLAYNIMSFDLFFVRKDFQMEYPSYVAPTFAQNVFWATFGAILISVLMTFTDIIFSKFLNKIRSFTKVVLTKSMIYILVISSTIIISMSIGFFINTNPDIKFTELLFSNMSLSIFFYSMFTSLFISFLEQVNRKFGPGILLSILIGKYYNPRAEKRIFMFLDLKSSTSHAEKLGHIRFSQLIQTCFQLLNEIVLKYNAEIYQYAGDEVILTWKWANGIRDQNCLKLFYNFRRLLKNQQDNFLKKYDLIPEFKAGVNGGEVTVVEIGDIKREIVYHGDVLNTGARIQEKCNEYNSSLLISHDLYKVFKSNENFRFDAIGAISLKGKERPVGLFRVSAE